MNKNAAALMLMASILCVGLCSQNRDNDEYECSQDLAGFIGCITPCCGDGVNDTAFMAKASPSCASFAMATSLGGCCAMLCGGACFLPCLHIPNAVAYSFVGSGAAMEFPALCATCAQSIYCCANCLEKRAFTERVDAMRRGKEDERCSLQGWWSCATDPLLNCCQWLFSPCFGESHSKEQWLLRDNSSNGAQCSAYTH